MKFRFCPPFTPSLSSVLLIFCIAISRPLAFGVEPPPPVGAAPVADAPPTDADTPNLLAQDARLRKRVTLALKAGDLKGLVETLTRQTEVPFYVHKDLEDVKLTALMKEIPLEDVLGQVARLFNLTWRRYGTAGKYRYQLTQTLPEKRAEEALRNKDSEEMLRNLLTKLDRLLPYRNMPKEELQRQKEENRQKAADAGTEAEKKRWEELANGAELLLSAPSYQDALQLYAALTPGQHRRFVEGEGINFTWAEKTLPRAVAQRLQKEQGKNIRFEGGTAADLPIDEARLEMGFRLDRDKEDRIDFVLRTQVGDKRGYSAMNSIAITGSPDRFEFPRSAPDPDLLKAHPDLAEKVTLEPSPELPPPL